MSEGSVSKVGRVVPFDLLIMLWSTIVLIAGFAIIYIKSYLTWGNLPALGGSGGFIYALTSVVITVSVLLCYLRIRELRPFTNRASTGDEPPGS